MHQTLPEISLIDTHVLFNEVLKADTTMTDDIIVPWIVFYAISTVVCSCLPAHTRQKLEMSVCLKVGVLAIFILLKNLVHAFRLHRQEIELEVEQDKPQAKLLKHRQRKEMASRKIQGTFACTPSTCEHIHTQPHMCTPVCVCAQARTNE